jgi:DNA (cytosine-5)-methyltransferase 1
MNYNWTLKDAVFTKDKGKVFSCFACGGGSTMGYKLAGFDVIGCNEIDPKMMKAYVENHNPKYSFLEGIQTFKLREDLPEELFNLDILDGSPPCSSFSMAGNRESDWGKEKKFREGQAEQVLDTLFFDFIDLAERLQPKVVIAENVKGLLLGEAKSYVIKIYEAFDKAGYVVQHFLLDASKMGVPQRRERVFFIALRKDLCKPFMEQVDFFTRLPKLTLEFNEREILFSELSDEQDKRIDLPPVAGKLWHKCAAGESLSSVPESNGNFFNDIKVSKEKVLPTLASQNKVYHCDIPRRLNNTEYLLGATFPTDYNTMDMKAFYICGMSVPPLMTGKIAEQVYNQWISKL